MDWDDNYDEMFADDLDAMQSMDEENFRNDTLIPSNSNPKKALSFTTEHNKSAPLVKNREGGQSVLSDIEDGITPLSPQSVNGNDSFSSSLISLKRKCDGTSNSVTKRSCGSPDINRPPVDCLSAILYKPITTSSTAKVFRTVPRHDFVSITSSLGNRVYLTRKSNNVFKEVISNSSVGGFNLLETSVRSMKQELLKQQEAATELQDEVDLSPEVGACNYLWVDHYMPRGYLDLLSDEATNRTLLKWLKLWDYLVFNKDKRLFKNSANEKKSQINRSTGAFNKNSGYGKDVNDKNNKKFSSFGELSEELDALKRPSQKFVILCGPPGLGKTTLAHVIASHAGYNVVEINASDDRSADLFKTKVEAATQMKAVMGVNPRPNCLIIDEIDGAPQAAVNVLLNMLKHSEGLGKRKKNLSPLLRPIICICNDLYVPSLRLLRAQSLILLFPPTVSSKLALRLVQVSQREGLHTDMTTLLALCEKTGNDIRSCLNTLQFVRSRMTEFDIGCLKSISVGEKDMHKGVFGYWKQIFAIPQKKMKDYVNPHELSERTPVRENVCASSDAKSRFSDCLQNAYMTGEYEKVLQGLHENYLNSKFKDTYFKLIGEAGEWFCFSDLISRKVYSEMNFSLMKYLPYHFVFFHLAFASNSHPKINFSNKQFELRTKQQRCATQSRLLLDEMLPSTRQHLNNRNILLQVLPFLLEIMHPNLRPINKQLYSSRENEEFARVLDLMIAFNLMYSQERSAEGQFIFKLDPNLEEMVKFGNNQNGRQPSYSLKQMISREIEQEKMRRKEGKRGALCAGPSDDEADKSQQIAGAEIKLQGKQISAEAGKQVPSHKRQNLDPKRIKEPGKAPCNFFRNFVKTARRPPRAEEAATSGGAQDSSFSDVWFSYQPGYTNAVRRIVRVRDLLA